MLVTSQRDGMNLVSYEFVSCQTEDNAGVLVLSEVAGAVLNAIGAGALSQIPTTSLTLQTPSRKALIMPEAEKIGAIPQQFLPPRFVHTSR